jgi:hypothetical protein
MTYQRLAIPHRIMIHKTQEQPAQTNVVSQDTDQSATSHDTILHTPPNPLHHNQSPAHSIVQPSNQVGLNPHASPLSPRIRHVPQHPLSFHSHSHSAGTEESGIIPIRHPQLYL